MYNKLICGDCGAMICLPLSKITKLGEAMEITIKNIKQHLQKN